MGYYTQMILCVQLKYDIPKSVQEALKFMRDGLEYNDDSIIWFSFKEEKCTNIPELDHPFWKQGRMPFFSRIKTEGPLSLFRANLKNYENEIEDFLDWIAPYCDAHDNQVCGFIIGEDFDYPWYIVAKEIPQKPEKEFSMQEPEIVVKFVKTRKRV